MRVCLRVTPRAFGPVLVCAWLLLWPAVAGAQSTPGSRVLVMPFTADVEPGASGGAGAALWLGEAASVLVTEGLTTLGVGALSRDERLAAFDQLNLPMTPALTRATMYRVAELIGASEVVFGEVHLGATLRVRARLVRLAAGREMPAVEEEGPLQEIFPVFGRLAARVGSETGRLRPTASVQTRALPLEAFENYVKGLVASTPAAQQHFLEAAAAQVPSDPRILLALWSVYEAQDLNDKALNAASAVTGDATLVRRARFAVALSLIDLKRYDGAFQTLTSLYSDGRSAPVSNALGIVQLRRGTPTGGTAPAAYFKRAVDEDAENTDYLFNLGYAYALTQDAANALLWLREVVRLDAADGDAHLVMSAVLSGAGRAAEAQREFDLAKLLGAVADTAARAPLARVPSGLERRPSAADVTSTVRLRTMVANPSQKDQKETAAFHLNNGRSLMAADRDRDAINELRRAIYLSPYDDEPHLLLGELYVRAGRLPDAIDEFKVAVWAKDSAAARVGLGRALLDSGDRDGARLQATQAQALAPASADVLDLIRKIGN